jgi:type VI secretion system secreted protein Hcp
MSFFTSKRLSCLILFAALLLPAHSQTYNMYLSMTGITGETNNLTAITSLQWGVGVSVSNPNSGPRNASPPSFSDITITKVLDSTSPKLALYCATGSRRTAAVITMKHPITNQTLYTIALEGVYITSVSSSSGGDRPVESLSLNFEKVTWTYQKLDSNGNPSGNPVTNNYDLRDGANN